MHPRRAGAAAWSIFLAATPGLADAVATPDYAIAVRLDVRSDARFEHPGPSTTSPSNPASTVAVGEQARQAYETIVRRMFLQPGPDTNPDLILDVSVAAAQTQPVAAGWVALVEHAVALRAASGTELATWRLRGESGILNDRVEGVPNAFARAADETARKFEWVFTDPPAVKQWLAARGVNPGAGLRGRWPERGDFLGYVDVGAGAVIGADGADGALNARAGVANRWFLAEIVAGHWTSTFNARSAFAGFPSWDMAPWNLGMHVGALRRIGSTFELRGGAGAELLWGAANNTYLGSQLSFSFRKLAPVVFAALQHSGALTQGGLRVRSSLEFRKYFGSSVDYPELERSVSIADTFLGFFLGFEIPWGPKPPRGEGRVR